MTEGRSLVKINTVQSVVLTRKSSDVHESVLSERSYCCWEHNVGLYQKAWNKRRNLGWVRLRSSKRILAQGHSHLLLIQSIHVRKQFLFQTLVQSFLFRILQNRTSFWCSVAAKVIWRSSEGRQKFAKLTRLAHQRSSSIVMVPHYERHCDHLLMVVLEIEVCGNIFSLSLRFLVLCFAHLYL